MADQRTRLFRLPETVQIDRDPIVVAQISHHAVGDHRRNRILDLNPPSPRLRHRNAIQNAPIPQPPNRVGDHHRLRIFPIDRHIHQQVSPSQPVCSRPHRHRQRRHPRRTRPVRRPHVPAPRTRSDARRPRRQSEIELLPIRLQRLRQGTIRICFRPRARTGRNRMHINRRTASGPADESRRVRHAPHQRPRPVPRLHARRPRRVRCPRRLSKRPHRVVPHDGILQLHMPEIQHPHPAAQIPRHRAPPQRQEAAVSPQARVVRHQVIRVHPRPQPAEIAVLKNRHRVGGPVIPPKIQRSAIHEIRPHHVQPPPVVHIQRLPASRHQRIAHHQRVHSRRALHLDRILKQVAEYALRHQHPRRIGLDRRHVHSSPHVLEPAISQLRISLVLVEQDPEPVRRRGARRREHHALPRRPLHRQVSPHAERHRWIHRHHAAVGDCQCPLRPRIPIHRHRVAHNVAHIVRSPPRAPPLLHPSPHPHPVVRHRVARRLIPQRLEIHTPVHRHRERRLSPAVEAVAEHSRVFAPPVVHVRIPQQHILCRHIRKNAPPHHRLRVQQEQPHRGQILEPAPLHPQRDPAIPFRPHPHRQVAEHAPRHVHTPRRIPVDMHPLVGRVPECAPVQEHITCPLHMHLSICHHARPAIFHHAVRQPPHAPGIEQQARPIPRLRIIQRRVGGESGPRRNQTPLNEQLAPQRLRPARPRFPVPGPKLHPHPRLDRQRGIRGHREIQPANVVGTACQCPRLVGYNVVGDRHPQCRHRHQHTPRSNHSEQSSAPHIPNLLALYFLLHHSVFHRWKTPKSNRKKPFSRSNNPTVYIKRPILSTLKHIPSSDITMR